MSTSAPKPLAILGSTGSIGVSTLEIIATFPERYRVISLTAGNNIALLKKQIERFHPEIVAVADEGAARQLRQQISGG
ncbi:MAG: 1-deoxy-D-xylulose-5-phosphate reductoisomerase, partial [Deltaproteobacteria bacterium]|nr:1-deoxy-D-xylulose-5-phosphate reductoisomerase [Deltaproteobacteria bacterium]